MPPARARLRTWLLAAALVVNAGAAATARADAMAEAMTDPAASVAFERRSTQLSDEALGAIAQHAERLKRDAETSVTLVAHPDKTGSPSYGVALAQRRATLVEETLVGLGVDPRQVHATVAGTGAAASCGDACGATVEFRYRLPEVADYRVSAHER